MRSLDYVERERDKNAICMLHIMGLGNFNMAANNGLDHVYPVMCNLSHDDFAELTYVVWGEIDGVSYCQKLGEGISSLCRNGKFSEVTLMALVNNPKNISSEVKSFLRKTDNQRLFTPAETELKLIHDEPSCTESHHFFGLIK